MTATQTQIRRDTAGNLASATPVLAELGYDETNKRLLVGDGTTLGGIPHTSFQDDRNGTFIRGTVGGTANAISLTLSPAALSYATGMRIGFIATSTNSGSTTVNVSGLGTRTIQKLNSGSLQNLASGDIVSGVYYEAIYNGTVFQLTTLYGAGLVSVGQGDLNTSVGTGSLSTNVTVVSTAEVMLNRSSLSSVPTGFTSRISDLLFGGPTTSGSSATLPGGQYGFYPRIRRVQTGNASRIEYQQRYITSSPPYDLGDGEVGGFFFAVVNSNGEIVQHYLADTPPWAYNGPTDIRASAKCPVTGKKFRKVMKERTFEQIMDGAKMEYKMEEITHSIKNKDMGLIPHPFGEIKEGHSVVLLDPMDDKVRRMIEYQNAGGNIGDMSKFTIDNTECKRKCPKGVKTHKFNYKFTKKF